LQPKGGFTQLKGGPFFQMYPVGVPFVPQTNAVPYVQNWELDLQFQLNRHDMVEAAYVGNHGAHLFGQNGNGSYGKGINMPSLSTVTTLGEAHTDFTTLTANPYGIVTSLGANISESVMNTLSPYPNFFYDSISELGERDYDSEYDAMYLSWTHRTSYGLSFLASFTWDKLLDDATEVNSSASIFGGGYGDFQNPYNLKAEKSPSVDELPTKFAMGASYQLPVGTGKKFTLGNKVLNEAFGNWVTSGNFQSWGGNPVDLHLGNAGYFFSVSPTNQSLGTYLPSYYNLRPNLVKGVPVINPNFKQDPLYNSWFNHAAFSMPGSLNAPALGSAPRTICCAPHVTTFDASLQKRFLLGKDTRYVQVEADALNALNHPQFFFNPNSGRNAFNGFNFGSIGTNQAPFTYQGGFGFVNLANSYGRILQMGLRLVW